MKKIFTKDFLMDFPAFIYHNFTLRINELYDLFIAEVIYASCTSMIAFLLAAFYSLLGFTDNYLNSALGLSLAFLLAGNALLLGAVFFMCLSYIGIYIKLYDSDFNQFAINIKDSLNSAKWFNANLENFVFISKKKCPFNLLFEDFVNNSKIDFGFNLHLVVRDKRINGDLVDIFSYDCFKEENKLEIFKHIRQEADHNQNGEKRVIIDHFIERMVNSLDLSSKDLYLIVYYFPHLREFISKQPKWKDSASFILEQILEITEREKEDVE